VTPAEPPAAIGAGITLARFGAVVAVIWPPGRAATSSRPFRIRCVVAVVQVFRPVSIRSVATPVVIVGVIVVDVVGWDHPEVGLQLLQRTHASPPRLPYLA